MEGRVIAQNHKLNELQTNVKIPWLQDVCSQKNIWFLRLIARSSSWQKFHNKNPQIFQPKYPPKQYLKILGTEAYMSTSVCTFIETLGPIVQIRERWEPLNHWKCWTWDGLQVLSALNISKLWNALLSMHFWRDVLDDSWRIFRTLDSPILKLQTKRG